MRENPAFLNVIPGPLSLQPSGPWIGTGVTALPDPLRQSSEGAALNGWRQHQRGRRRRLAMRPAPSGGISTHLIRSSLFGLSPDL